jgi:hypothetical protein
MGGADQRPIRHRQSAAPCWSNVPRAACECAASTDKNSTQITKPLAEASEAIESQTSMSCRLIHCGGNTLGILLIPSNRDERQPQNADAVCPENYEKTGKPSVAFYQRVQREVPNRNAIIGERLNGL